MTRIHLNNKNIKDLSRDFDEVISRLDAKDKRRRKGNDKHRKEKKPKK